MARAHWPGGSTLPPPCTDEDAAYELMETLRWGDQPTCPRCGGRDVYKVRGRDGGRGQHYRWCCRDCGRRQYTVRTGTVMEHTRLPLRHWCYACWAVSKSRSGASPLQIARQTGMSVRSARDLLRRLSYAMAIGFPGPQTDGDGHEGAGSSAAHDA